MEKEDFLSDKILLEITRKYKNLSPSQRVDFSRDLLTQFSDAIADIQRHVDEVEFGEHVEGIHFSGYDYRYDSSGIFPYRR